MTDQIATLQQAIEAAANAMIDHWPGDRGATAARIIRALASRIPAPDEDVVDRVARALFDAQSTEVGMKLLVATMAAHNDRPDDHDRFMARAAIAAMPDQAAEVERLTRERNDWKQHATRVVAEARACMDAQTEIDEAWDAIGTRGNRAALSLAEQVASLCRELDDGSFYKESDIDALQDRATAAEVERDRLRAALERLIELDHPDARPTGSEIIDAWADAHAALDPPR